MGLDLAGFFGLYSLNDLWPQIWKLGVWNRSGGGLVTWMLLAATFVGGGQKEEGEKNKRNWKPLGFEGGWDWKKRRGDVGLKSGDKRDERIKSANVAIPSTLKTCIPTWFFHSSAEILLGYAQSFRFLNPLELWRREPDWLVGWPNHMAAWKGSNTWGMEEKGEEEENMGAIKRWGIIENLGQD